MKKTVKRAMALLMAAAIMICHVPQISQAGMAETEWKMESEKKEAIAETESELQSENETESQTESETDTEIASESEIESESQRQTEKETEEKAASESEKKETEQLSETETEQQTEPSTEEQETDSVKENKDRILPRSFSVLRAVAESTPRALPEPAGNPLTTYPNAKVNLVDFATFQIPSTYSFYAKYTEQTTHRSYGCTGYLEDVVAADANLELPEDVKSQDRYYQNRAIKILTKEPSEYGDFGIWYYNVGVYNNRAVDIKVIIKDFAYETNHGTQLGAIGFDVSSIGVMLSCIDWVKVRYEYYYHDGTETPKENAHIKGYHTLSDIDDTQAVCFQSPVTQMYVDNSNDNLKWYEFEGENYIYGRAGQIDATPKKGQLAWTFDGTTQTYVYRSSVIQHYTHENTAATMAAAKKNHLSAQLYKGRAYFLYEAIGALQVENKRGSVKIRKTDEKTGKNLRGAQFTLYKKQGDSYVSQGNLVYDEIEERYQKNDLDNGQYKVVETKFPDRFVQEKVPWSSEFTIDNNDDSKKGIHL